LRKLPRTLQLSNSGESSPAIRASMIRRPDTPSQSLATEDNFKLNPAQVKALQGRKSDGRDAKRIAEFLQDGRLDPSFVAPPEIRVLRQLLRHRLSLLHERNEVHNQIRDLPEHSTPAAN